MSQKKHNATRLYSHRPSRAQLFEIILMASCAFPFTVIMLYRHVILLGRMFCQQYL